MWIHKEVGAFISLNRACFNVPTDASLHTVAIKARVIHEYEKLSNDGNIGIAYNTSKVHLGSVPK